MAITYFETIENGMIDNQFPQRKVEVPVYMSKILLSVMLMNWLNLICPQLTWKSNG